MQPQPHSFVAQTENYRAMTIPWVRARANSVPAGLLAHGSQLDTHLPGRPATGGFQWLLPRRAACVSRYPLTVAGTAAELGASSRTAFPFKPLAKHRCDH